MAGLGGVWYQQLQRDVEILFYPEPFPNPSSEHLPAIPLSREAAPELRGELPAPPTPGGSGLGFGVRRELGNRRWKEGREVLHGGKGRAAAGEAVGADPAFPRGFVCPVQGVSSRGQALSRGDKNQPKGSPSFPSAADPALADPSPDSFHVVAQSLMRFDSSGRL